MYFGDTECAYILKLSTRKWRVAFKNMQYEETSSENTAMKKAEEMLVNYLAKRMLGEGF
jgi:hypothetical protein